MSETKEKKKPEPTIADVMAMVQGLQEELKSKDQQIATLKANEGVLARNFKAYSEDDVDAAREKIASTGLRQRKGKHPYHFEFVFGDDFSVPLSNATFTFNSDIDPELDKNGEVGDSAKQMVVAEYNIWSSTTVTPDNVVLTVAQ
jgi:hypothetical protein